MKDKNVLLIGGAWDGRRLLMPENQTTLDLLGAPRVICPDTWPRNDTKNGAVSITYAIEPICIVMPAAGDAIPLHLGLAPGVTLLEGAKRLIDAYSLYAQHVAKEESNTDDRH